MKRVMIITITICILLAFSDLISETWEIKQDGTGDFTTISEGITAAQDGDTLLVYPGVYYERINYSGKNITITSLYDGDQYDESYIANTVIDGNREGTVVNFRTNETRDAVLNGFTVRNGFGSFHPGIPRNRSGGGIYIRHASPTISNCHIKHNRADRGGGIFLITSGNPLLQGNIISHNHATQHGGICSYGLNAVFEFCSDSLNSIYLNYGGRGTDIYLGEINQPTVVIDTLTVRYPDRYFVGYRHVVPQELELVVNHGKIVPVPADLYVSPDGCDTNSGLSPEDPLQTIAMAMIKILPDSLQQRTVHVSEGIYTRSANNQKFPIVPRNHIRISGASKETTILDLERETLAIYGFNMDTDHYPGDDQSNFITNYVIRNFTFANGGNPMDDWGSGAIHLYFNSALTFENLDIYNCHTGNYPGIEFGREVVMIYHSTDITMKNIRIGNCSGKDALHIGSGWGSHQNIYAENLWIHNILPGPWYESYTGGEGGGLLIMTVDTIETIPINATLVNTLITDCIIDNIDPVWGNPPFSHLSFGAPIGQVRVVNATVGNNYATTVSGSGIKFGGGMEFELINSIVYGNSPYNVSIVNPLHNTSNIHISHSLIQGGQDDILYYSNPNTVLHWGEGNIDADPLWVGEVYPDYDGDYPYMLSEFSPARNAGTLDIPDFEFPEYDLAGNPRIYGNSIDMGAYEWNPDVGVENYDEAIPDLSIHDYQLHNYPNPVVSMKGMGRGEGVGMTISFVMPVEGEAVIDIYNLKGQFVRRLFNAFVQKGEYEVLWNGRDEQERIVSTGFYMYRLQINGETVATGRCTFVK